MPLKAIMVFYFSADCMDLWDLMGLLKSSKPEKILMLQFFPFFNNGVQVSGKDEMFEY